MRKLTRDEIEKLASRPKVRRIAVENFLGSMPDIDPIYTAMNMHADARSYGWNTATVAAIMTGITLAECG